LKCHISQSSKRYLTYESMVHLTSFRGGQVNLSFAEAFEVVRYVEKNVESGDLLKVDEERAHPPIEK
jgi:hypothetical protein